MALFLGIVVSYLIGSISTSYIAGKRLKGIDIRQHGSGNAGATNSMRVLGKRVAVVVLLIDLLKGVLAVAIGNALTHSAMGMAACGLASIFGHNWPVYYGFRGGKGAATSIGVALSFSTPAALLAGVLAILLLVVFRYVSLAAITFTVLFPLALYFLHRPTPFVVAAILVALLSVWRHRSNVKRLIQGNERKLGSS